MPEKKKLCMVCAKPSAESICEACKANIQGEVLEKKLKVERKAPVDVKIPPKPPLKDGK